MLRSIITLILLASLLPASASAREKPLTGRVEKWKLPHDCTTLDPCYYTSPPITIIRPDSANLADSIACAEIWFRCHLNDSGRVTDAALVYSSTGDRGLRNRAREALMATAYDPKWPGRSACGLSFLHVVLIRKELPAPFELTYGKPEERNEKELQQLPEMISEARPVYSKPLKIAEITGTVMLSALVDTLGNVSEAAIAKTSGNPLLDNAGLLAAYYNRFKPGIKDGRPIPCRVKYKIDFTISHE